MLVLLALLGGCAGPAAAPSGDENRPFRVGREDYRAFREQHPGILEPNYLPFMTWRVAAPPRRSLAGVFERLGLVAPAPPAERLILCRWEPEDFPLRVHVEPPVIGDELHEPVRPRPPGEYVAAAWRALAIWERDLEGLVRFLPAEGPGGGSLTLRLIGAEAPVPDPGVKVLGTTPVKEACRVRSRLGAAPGGPGEAPLEVEFRVRELNVFIADEFGLLLPDQVEKVALHEIGHALGMRRHSPIPADLMYAQARDRIPRDGLGAEDVNSFLSLYALPNGTVYADPAAPPPPDPRPLLPSGEPQLALAPHVDTARGFEVQVPSGWTRIETPYGVAMVNGTAWDGEASIQLNVHRFDTIGEYLERYGRGHVLRSALVASAELRVSGKPARQVVLHTVRETREVLTLVESGDGRVLVSIAECPADVYEAYRPWFAAVLGSLQVADPATRGQDRDYTP